ACDSVRRVICAWIRMRTHTRKAEHRAPAQRKPGEKRSRLKPQPVPYEQKGSTEAPEPDRGVAPGITG
ncbi:MAG TPA: hypothetical protein PK760_02805, partial [Flavobacteriales bacterium]|nr:hypothetical protein [Flavobacteriales bacterium]